MPGAALRPDALFASPRKKYFACLSFCPLCGVQFGEEIGSPGVNNEKLLAAFFSAKLA